MTKALLRRKPTPPGTILREEFLTPLGMTQKELADHLGCDVKVVNRFVNCRAAVTAAMALKLGAARRYRSHCCTCDDGRRGIAETPARKLRP